MPSTKNHLQSVNESYFQHMKHALSFTTAMFFGGICCLIHAFFPSLLQQKGSTIILSLHDRMVLNRDNLNKMSAGEGRGDKGSETSQL